MNQEARLARALSASGAPPADPAFVLAVMEQAERERFKARAALRLLRSAGLAAAIAAAAVPFLAWAAENSESLQTGLVTAMGLVALVWTARVMTERSGAAWGR
jgi:hypothetical protein